jgi:hypothetical protein
MRIETQWGWWTDTERGLSEFYPTSDERAANHAAKCWNLANGHLCTGGALYGSESQYRRESVDVRRLSIH